MDEHSSLSESQINGAGNGSLGTKTNDSILNSQDLVQAGGSGNLGSDAVGNEIGQVKRGRGRPRKIEGAVPKLGTNFPQPVAISPVPVNIAKRGRGRPKGSGKLQQLFAASGGRAGGETDANFTPHIIHVRSEEDLYATIRSFAQARSICVLSATGLVSSVVIRHPDSTTSLKYDGPFEIITLNGSVINGSMLLSISLAKSNGNVFGGAVVGPIIAACPIQLLVASFTPNIIKEVESKNAVEPSSAVTSYVSPDVANGPVYYPRMIEADDMCNTPVSAPPGFVMKPENFMVQNPNFNYNSLQNVDPRALLSQTQQSMEDELISQHPNNGIP